MCQSEIARNLLKSKDLGKREAIGESVVFSHLGKFYVMEAVASDQRRWIGRPEGVGSHSRNAERHAGGRDLRFLVKKAAASG